MEMLLRTVRFFLALCILGLDAVGAWTIYLICIKNSVVLAVLFCALLFAVHILWFVTMPAPPCEAKEETRIDPPPYTETEEELISP